MRRYDDPVEVRKGLLDHDQEGPEQFLWRGKLWKVRTVLAHWVETGSWWQSADARAVLGTDDPGDTPPLVEEGRSPVTRPGARTSLVEEGAPAPVTRPRARTSLVEEGAPAPVTRPGDRTSLVEEGAPAPVTRPGDRTGIRTGDLLEEREFWRVEAGDSRGGGVFDLSFDWSDGSWQLVGCVD